MRWLCASALALPVLCYAQAAPPAAKAVTLNVSAASYTRYPSLEPVTLIDVQLGDSAAISAVLKQAIKGSSHWNCAAISSYQVSLYEGASTTPSRTLPIASVNTALTHCAPNDIDLNAVQITLRSPLTKNDKYQVTLRNLGDPSPVVQSAAAAPGNVGSAVVFTATPQSAPGETLTNKKTRDVGQLAVSFTDSDFVANLPVDIYVKSTDLFSTDEKDAKSAFLGTVGFNRGLLRNWYTPFHLEGGMQGNQIATNLSAVVNSGVTTLIPWHAVISPAIQAPLPPEFTLNQQYTNRIRQASTSKPLATDDYSLNPSLSWSSISFPWPCPSSAKKTAAPQYQYCFGVEMNLGLWYLPLDLTGKGSQRVEGYGDISILIPLSSLSFAKGIFPYVTSGDYSKSRIRVKYSDSVSVANNFIRTRDWTYGIELIK